MCTGCGTRAEEWRADPAAYVAEFDRCPGCELLSQEQENVPDTARGVRIFLRRPSPDDEEVMEPC